MRTLMSLAPIYICVRELMQVLFRNSSSLISVSLEMLNGIIACMPLRIAVEFVFLLTFVWQLLSCFESGALSLDRLRWLLAGF